MPPNPSGPSPILGPTGNRDSTTIVEKKRRLQNGFAMPMPPDLNSLEGILQDGGFCQLDHEHGPHIISKPHELRWSLERRLKSNQIMLERVTNELTTMFEDDADFSKALQPSSMLNNDSLSVEIESGLNNQANDSLIRVLLGVPCLQEHIVDILLEKLPEFVGDQDTSTLWTNIPRLIVFQLRFLDSVYNESRLCEKLLLLLSGCPVSMQKEILSAIPDILSDQSHERIVETLQSILEEDVTLTVHILNTLSNLDLPVDMMNSARKTAICALQTSPVNDLPIIIRFIMQSCTKKDALSTMASLLESLYSFSFNRTHYASKAHSDIVLFVLEQLQNGVTFHKYVAASLMKCLHASEISQICPTVVWILLFLNDQPIYSNKAANTLRRWIAKDVNDSLPGIFECSLVNHDEVVTMTLKSTINLAEIMLRSTDIRDQDIGDVLYRCIYSRSSSKANILSSIITHIGSKQRHEADRGLQLLLHLCTCSPDSVRPYFSYLQGLLDYCHRLSNIQLRMLFTSFAQCQGGCSQTILAQSSDIMIYIKKNFQQPVFMYQRAGIIGAICYINACVPPSAPFDDDHDIYSLLIDPLTQYTSKSHAATAFLCDEILYCLKRRQINIPVVDRLLVPVVQMFQDFFLVSSEEKINVPLLQVSTLYRFEQLNEDSDDSSSVSILPGLSQASRRSAFQMLSSHVELLCCYSQCDDNAEPDEDGYSSMPLILFNSQDINDVLEFDHDLLTLAFSTLVHASNWFRSILNAFSSHPDPSMQWKCSRRLSQLLEIRELLCRFSPESIASVVPYGISQSQRAILQSRKAIKQKKVLEDVLSYRLEPLLRPFVPSVYSLMSLQLNLGRSFENQENDQACIYLDTFRYLIQEFHDSIKSITAKPFVGKISSRESVFESREQVDFIEFFKSLGYSGDQNCSDGKIFGALGSKLKALCTREIAESEEQVLILQILTLILRSMHLIVNCQTLQTTRGKHLLTAILLDFVKGGEQQAALPDLVDIQKDFGQFLLQLIPLPIASLDVQVLICTIVDDLLRSRICGDNRELQEALSTASFDLLTQYWRSDYKLGGNAAALIRYYIAHSSDPLAVVENLVVSEFPRVFQDEHSDDDLSPFADSLTKATWSCFFKACAQRISASLDIVEPSVSALMQQLEHRAKLFSSLLAFIVNCPKQGTLNTAISTGQTFMDGIIQQLPLLKREFNNNPAEAIALINSVQKTTRMLQRICDHVKREKNTALMGRIPSLKKTLETFVYRVKDVFFHNDLLYKSDFKCATLKHRTIDGREVRSSEDEADEAEQEWGEDNEGSEGGPNEFGEDSAGPDDGESGNDGIDDEGVDDEATEEFHC